MFDITLPVHLSPYLLHQSSSYLLAVFQNKLDQAYIQQLLDLIATEQSAGDAFTQSGVFRGQRFSPFWGDYEREENNIFMTLTVLHPLLRVLPALNLAGQNQIWQMHNKVKPLLPYYINPHDGLSVNYWPRFPGGHFPNGYLYHTNARFKAPDDIDDTGYALMVFGPDYFDISRLKDKVKPYCQGVTRKNRKLPATLSRYKAYNTWMGHHMAVDVDVCVLANFLPPLLAGRSDLNEHDIASLDYLVQVLEEQWYKSIPQFVLGYYFKIPVMAYHLARHLSLLPSPWSDKIKAALIRDWAYISVQHEVPMHKLVLDSAACYLGLEPARMQPVSVQEALQPYICYYMGMMTALDFPVLNQLADQGIFQVRKKCKSFNLALLLENTVLRAGYMPGPLWWS